MKNSLDNILKRMANDEKETRNHEFQPSVKKFKPNPENMEKMTQWNLKVTSGLRSKNLERTLF